MAVIRRLHRNTAPVYHLLGGVAGPFPAEDVGTAIDYVNNPVGNGDTGLPANAATTKHASGQNQGSYFIGWQDDLTSEEANRIAHALSENTDMLDDLLHRDQTELFVDGPFTAGLLGDATFDVFDENEAYVGAVAPYPTAGQLFKLVDAQGNQIFRDDTGTPCEVTGITGATIGDGWVPYGTTITLSISPTIPAGTVYYVVYGVRSNLAVLDHRAIGQNLIESRVRVPGHLQTLLWQLQGTHLTGAQQDWNATPLGNIGQLAGRGLQEIYSRTPSVNTTLQPFGSWLSATAYSTQGAGSWFLRKGPALTGFSKDPDLLTPEVLYADSLNAVFRANLNDENTCGSTGFAVIGGRGLASDAGQELYPSFASFLHLYQDMEVNPLADRYVHLGASGAYDGFAGAPATATLVGGELEVTLTDTDDRLWLTVGPDKITSICVGYDMLELRMDWTSPGYDKRPVMCVITSLDTTDERKCKVRRLDGKPFSFTPPGATGVRTGVARLMRLHWGVSDGGPEKQVAVEGSNPQPLGLRGMVFMVGAKSTTAATDYNKEGARFIGDVDATKVFSWGRRTRTVTSAQSATYQERGYLRADGLLNCQAVAAPSIQSSLNMGTPIFRREYGVYDVSASGVQPLSLSAIMAAYWHIRLTITAGAAVTFSGITFPSFTLPDDEGKEIHLLFHHQTFAAQVSAPTAWPSEVRFEQPQDALLSGVPATVDHYIFTVTDILGSARLLGRVRRYTV